MFLNVKNLSKSYGHHEPVIKKLNFSLKKGEIISFFPNPMTSEAA